MSKVIILKDILDEEGDIRFIKGNKYRLLHKDGTGYYISEFEKGLVCSHFPPEAINVEFEILN